MTADAPGAIGTNPRTHKEILVILSSLMLGMLLAALDQTVLASALPTIVGELGGLDHLAWVITAYLLTSTTSVPLYGKISDLYGRKQLFQLAIVIFLVGSMLSGASQSMLMLIIFRGIQGLGAGGIMSMAQAIIGDIVSPRERGKYVGYFSGVFALSSVGGPLLGGLFTDELSWRWIFYINLPLGLVALVVATRVLHLPVMHVKKKVDYLGAALIVAATTCLLLGLTWGGSEYAWDSIEIVGLFVAAIVLTAAFVLQELRVSEPILPLRLFRDSTFTVSNAMAMITGMAMFGTIAFLPLFMQVVKGTSATESGLRTTPLMLGLLTMSILSGQMITKTGRYRIYPIIGTAILTMGLFLLSYLDAGSSWLEISAYMFFCGIGIGLVMQVVLLAVQNSVDPRDMGTGTAALTFFRSMGGALGVAVFGAVLSNRLGVYMERFVPEDVRSNIDAASLRSSPERIRALPVEVHHGVIEAFSHSLDDVFFWAVPVALSAFALSWLLKEIPLRQHAGPASAEADAGQPVELVDLV